jgi:hypothetical protein
MRGVDYAAAVIASIAGVITVKALTTGSMSSQEQISQLLNMAGKVPGNFAKNALGLPLWNPLNTGSCASPQLQMSLHLGGMTAIGVCAWQPVHPVWTLRLALSCFGLLPLLLIYLWRTSPRPIWTSDLLLRSCILFGTLSFLIAPGIGSSAPRLFNYAWPLFIVAVPMLATQHLRLSGKFA